MSSGCPCRAEKGRPQRVGRAPRVLGLPDRNPRAGGPEARHDARDPEAPRSAREGVRGGLQLRVCGLSMTTYEYRLAEGILLRKEAAPPSYEKIWTLQALINSEWTT